MTSTLGHLEDLFEAYSRASTLAWRRWIPLKPQLCVFFSLVLWIFQPSIDGEDWLKERAWPLLCSALLTDLTEPSNPQAPTPNSDTLTTRSRYIQTPCLQWNRTVDNTHLDALEIYEEITNPDFLFYTNIPHTPHFIFKPSIITIMDFMTTRFTGINKSGLFSMYNCPECSQKCVIKYN